MSMSATDVSIALAVVFDLWMDSFNSDFTHMSEEKSLRLLANNLNDLACNILSKNMEVIN